jgi:putative transposase
MPDYRRVYTPGGAIFLTLVTFNRRPIFAEPDNVKRLRQAAIAVKAEMPLSLRGRSWRWVN